ncbi:M28 family peptidase [Hydrotalea sp.]|uniref:M28 family peptidase n=1 Tax=Hydrotalea sp. TaxID=2881279 RepID=UPI002625E9AE|nr:M28 family peptidase [Hydrotalea sp.]
MRLFKSVLLLFFSAGTIVVQAQSALDKIITEKEVSRIENILAADDMQGRRVFTPGIEKAAGFIIDEFKRAGLQTLEANGSYRQNFMMLKPEHVTAGLQIDGNEIPATHFLIRSPEKSLNINENSGYTAVAIPAGTDFFSHLLRLLQANHNQIIFIDTAYAKYFPRLTYFSRQFLQNAASTVFVLTDQTHPEHFNLKAQQTFTEIPLSNIVGILPGKKLPNEYVIFSGHYDHLGIGKPVNGDSLYNGANDDAAGTTAVIMLAKYYARLNNHVRTLVFAAFTAEEIGEYGSAYFSEQFNPDAVKAMFNIEMIGTESKWGTNSAYITGFDKTDMGQIMQHNLKGTPFTFYPDPYTEQNLFYRSDNATLAKKGVPAHTISTSKMDNEPNYHKPSDEVKTLNLSNMTAIIRAIALSAQSIVNGEDTPTRVDTTQLR